MEDLDCLFFCLMIVWYGNVVVNESDLLWKCVVVDIS
jgi:hypothetical protein